MPKIMTEREAERWQFERWLKGADPATEAEARAKGERDVQAGQPM